MNFDTKSLMGDFDAKSIMNTVTSFDPQELFFHKPSTSLLDPLAQVVEDSKHNANVNVIPYEHIELTYEKRSPLYRHLELGEWDECRERAGTNPEEVQAWHERAPFDDTAPARLHLPLHFALERRAPKDVVTALLASFQRAVEHPDHDGRLPLHLLMDQGNPDQRLLDALRALDTADPPAFLTKRDKQGRVALSIHGRTTTPLYQAIEQRDWKTASARLHEHPEEASIWVTKLEEEEEDNDKKEEEEDAKKKNGKKKKKSAAAAPLNKKVNASAPMRWRLTTLHASIVYGAPVHFVEALMEVYPILVRSRDDEGMLPLHLAFKSGDTTHEDVMKALLEEYPEGVRCRDKYEQIPFDYSTPVQRTQRGLIEAYTDAVVKLEKEDLAREKDEVMTMTLQANSRAFEDEVKTVRAEEAEKLNEKSVLIAKVKRDHAKEIKRIKAEHSKEKAKIVVQMEEENNRAKKDLQQKLSKSNGEILELTKKVEELMEEKKTLTDKIGTLQTELEAAQAIVHRRNTIVDEVMKVREADDVKTIDETTNNEDKSVNDVEVIIEGGPLSKPKWDDVSKITDAFNIR